MKLAWLFFALFFFQEEPPLKPFDEFEVKLNFEFKDREAKDPNTIELNQTRKEYEKSYASGPAPYLFLNVKVLKPTLEEERIRIIENGLRNVFNKKFDMSSILKLELGFTDDIKDRVKAYEYTIYYLNKEKTPVSKIVIYFEEDGTYLVNGQVRGKI